MPRASPLSGRVDNPAEAAQAARDRPRLHQSKARASTTSSACRRSTQVTLRVRIAEVSREVMRNLGINWQAIGAIGSIGNFPALTFCRESPSTATSRLAATQALLGREASTASSTRWRKTSSPTSSPNRTSPR